MTCTETLLQSDLTIRGFVLKKCKHNKKSHLVVLPNY